MNNLIEKKVAYGTGAGGIVTLILGLAATYHWFTPPPPYLTALGVSLLSGLVGYLAPHTTLPGDSQAPVVDTSAFSGAVRALRMDFADLKALIRPSAAVQPTSAAVVQTPATSTTTITHLPTTQAGLSDRAPGSYPYPQPPATGGTTS